MSPEDLEALIALCGLALTDLERYDEGTPYETLQIGTTFQRLATPLVSGGELVPAFRSALPIVRQHDVWRSVRHLQTAAAFTKGASVQRYGSEVRVVREALEGLLAKAALPSKAKHTGPWTVFYSWQATLPGATNRSLIRKCLDSAVTALNTEVEVNDSLRVDSDTGGRPGSPKIFDTILDKIDQCNIFVADVSLVAPRQSNSNVMVELGYALKVLGPEGIVMVCNTAFGSMSDLPFDLGFNRVIHYACPEEGADKAAVRAALTPQLKSAIAGIIRAQGD